MNIGLFSSQSGAPVFCSYPTGTVSCSALEKLWVSVYEHKGYIVKRIPRLKGLTISYALNRKLLTILIIIVTAWLKETNQKDQAEHRASPGQARMVWFLGGCCVSIHLTLVDNGWGNIATTQSMLQNDRRGWGHISKGIIIILIIIIIFIILLFLIEHSYNKITFL